MVISLPDEIFNYLRASPFNRVGELLAQRIRKVKIVEMWKEDSSTAVISKEREASERIADKIARQKPDLVIAGQADWGICTSWLVVDQLNLEKKGIPTVTVATTAFVDLIKASLKEQGVGEMSLVVVEHPIAGHNLAGIQKKAEIAFPDILRACTLWQPK